MTIMRGRTRGAEILGGNRDDGSGVQSFLSV